MSSWQLQPHPSPHSYLHDRQPIVILFFTLNLISISPSSIPITFLPQSTSSTLVRILLPSISSLLWPPIFFRLIESHFDRHPSSLSSSCPFPFLPSPSPSVHILVPFSNLNFHWLPLVPDSHSLKHSYHQIQYYLLVWWSTSVPWQQRKPSANYQA